MLKQSVFCYAECQSKPAWQAALRGTLWKRKLHSKKVLMVCKGMHFREMFEIETLWPEMIEVEQLVLSLLKETVVAANPSVRTSI